MLERKRNQFMFLSEFYNIFRQMSSVFKIFCLYIQNMELYFVFFALMNCKKLFIFNKARKNRVLRERRNNENKKIRILDVNEYFFWRKNLTNKGECAILWKHKKRDLIINGVWHSLVVRLVRDQEAAGSSPVTPTTQFGEYQQENRFDRPDQGGFLVYFVGCY